MRTPEESAALDALTDLAISWKDSGHDLLAVSWMDSIRHVAIVREQAAQERRRLQAEGIEKAKQEGKYKGRKPADPLKLEEALGFIDKGLTRQQAADAARVGVATLYRHLKEQKQNENIT